MNEKYNHIDKDLFNKWQQESNYNSQQLNTNEMEKLLKKVSSDFSDSIKKTIKMDMVFKSCLIAGFLIIMALFLNSIFVLVTSIVFILLGTIGLFAENGFLKGIIQVQAMDRKFGDLVRDELKFYRSNLIKYPVVLSISIAMFYVLGSMIYHAITYGFIEPIKDTTDVIVLTSLLLLGVIISISANFPYFKSKIKNLEALLNDFGNEESFIAREKEIKINKQITLAIYILIGVVGIIALIYILTQ